MATKSHSIRNKPYKLSLSFGVVGLLLIVSTLGSYQIGVLVRQSLVGELGQNRTASVPSWLSINRWVHCDQTDDNDGFCGIRPPSTTFVEGESDSSNSDSEDLKNDSVSHESLGQHLLAQVNPTDDTLLTDNQVLSILKFAASKGWVLKAYFCSKILCQFLFQDGHRMTLHELTNVLDIFSPSTSCLQNWLGSVPILMSQWGYHPRATPYDPAVFDAGTNDMYNFVLGSLEFTYKKLIAREVSHFQEVSIYDTIDPRILSYRDYKAANAAKSSYYQQHKAFYQADRQMFLDGVVQSRKLGERAYHEALVHPAMIMHANPERVAIIGAGEGATLREVLKHSSLKEVIMIEIDDLVMDLSRKYLTQWNDCSDIRLPAGLINPTGNCFDDPRAKVYAEDAIRWFMERYPENSTEHEVFDVIIMDALDPGDKVEFSDILFDNTELVATLHRALSSRGIFGCQTGEQTYLDDPNPMWTRDRHALNFLQNLGKVGFQRFFDYEEASTRFSGLWSYLLASKSSDPSEWFANSAKVDLLLHQRAMPTKSGKWPFQYFDGATMMSYQATTRPVADVQCRTNSNYRWPSCQRGPGLFDGINVPAPAAWKLDDGQAVALTDLLPGYHVGLEECVHQTWEIPEKNVELISLLAESKFESSSKWTSLLDIIKKYGLVAPILGERAVTVDMGQDAWMYKCRATEAVLEPYDASVSNYMMERFWKIHTCVAKRRVVRTVTEGGKATCMGAVQ